MKKLLILASIAFFGFSSCDREERLNPTYPFEITVKTLADSLRVSNVFIEVIAQTGQGRSTIIFDKFSNEDGEATFEYDQEAVFLIRTTRGKKPNYSFIGCDYIFLKPNEEAKRTIYIRPYYDLAQGC